MVLPQPGSGSALAVAGLEPSSESAGWAIVPLLPPEGLSAACSAAAEGSLSLPPDRQQDC